MTVFRVLRVLRLVKLLRLLRASKRLKEWSVSVAWPRSVLTIASCFTESFYLMHLGGCMFGIIAIVPESPLDTWYATHGYCRPVGDTHECVGAEVLYFQCIWWASGILLGAPIGITPHKGPWGRHYSVPDDERLLTYPEQSVVFLLKLATAFVWVTVVARFVQVYNNLDPDARDFSQGWDALNRFVSYFKVAPLDARELRRFYIERADEARAKSRKRVMNDFSPYLAEKFVWKLNKDWLVKVPCFSLVVERLMNNPNSGLERFLVKVALAMQPSVYVPTERPPAQRLYIITDGIAIVRVSQAIVKLTAAMPCGLNMACPTRVHRGARARVSARSCRFHLVSHSPRIACASVAAHRPPRLASPHPLCPYFTLHGMCDRTGTKGRQG